ncbi:protein POOR HOMOLOGOUS SYNAPSIS 1 [Gastrolobium bilobum]|uniref:protein POOR HOMOLOGOUS SYNAPSIS 1 n=1 Tax=Gastrolobium bilobum TaxID=150636 RepID=UPI002AB235C1|nr:protein POOR HOMOLOGOUS SYNAPSIS 1 [Gastrolobium bilobum]
MAGFLAMISSNANNNSNAIDHSIRDQWEICFARFVPYPITSTSTSSDLLPLPPRLRNRSPRGNWISSSSVAFLRLFSDLSISDVILTVSFNAKLLEEHYVSKLHFSWPQVSCVSGFPARGTRTVIVSYRDSVGEIQKFAMRFPSIYEAQSFINALKEILKDEKSPEPLNTDFGSEISAQSEFMSSNKHSHRACEELNFLTPVDSYIPQMPQCMNNEGEQPSGTQEKETIPGNNVEGILPALPPSFASLLMDCSEISHAQATVSEEVDLKSQIVRYMEDSSFQDMLIKVEKVISEIGGDMSI